MLVPAVLTIPFHIKSNIFRYIEIMCLGRRENDDNGSSSPPPLLAEAWALWHKLWPKKIVTIIDWISLTLELNVDISPWQMGPSNQTKLEFQDSLSLVHCKTKTLPVRNWVAWSHYVSHLSSLNADKATIWETAATLLKCICWKSKQK